MQYYQYSCTETPFNLNSPYTICKRNIFFCGKYISNISSSMVLLFKNFRIRERPAIKVFIQDGPFRKCTSQPMWTLPRTSLKYISRIQLEGDLNMLRMQCIIKYVVLILEHIRTYQRYIYHMNLWQSSQNQPGQENLKSMTLLKMSSDISENGHGVLTKMLYSKCRITYRIQDTKHTHQGTGIWNVNVRTFWWWDCHHKHK